MSSETGLEDLSMMDLFRSEVETHSEVLSAALLALERSPGDRSRLDEMMRAAHSVKGAARVVGVDVAVSVAHAMEDCLVAAQKGALALSPGDVDVLLRGVDLLGQISEATKDPQDDLATAFDQSVKSLVVELEAMLARGERPSGVPAEVAAAPVPGPPAIEASGPNPVTPPPVEHTATLTNATTIKVPEILDSMAAEEIRRQYLSAVERGSDSVRIDLRATKDLDVQGLALLAAIPRHAAQHGCPRLRLAGVSAEMETVLGVTGLSGSYGVRPGPAPEDA
jgi:two-component system sensor histidine kinase and response regulator WspE